MSTCNNPEHILSVLSRVCGDGHTLAQLQQRFFAHQQREDEDFLPCSLPLVEVFERITQLDGAFKACRVCTLKGRLAEAVMDEGLHTLRTSAPEHQESRANYFDTLDRALQWMGSTDPPKKQEAKACDVKVDDGVRELLCQKSEMLMKQ